MRILHVMFGLCLIAVPGCDTGTQLSGGPAFAIYRLKDQNLTASQIWDRSLDSLILSDTPFLALNDLRSYWWQTHQFSVTASVDTQLSILRRSNGPVGGIPFVVTAGKDRIYLGAFWYAYSSLAPQVPFIEVISDPHRIQKSWNPQEQFDKRNDPRIHDALQASGALIE